METAKHNLLEFGEFFVGGEILRKIFKALTMAAGETAISHVKSKLPMFLGLRPDDESAWATLWSKLTSNEKKLITNLLITFEDYERDSLRYVVINIKDEEKKVISRSKAKKEEAKKGKEEAKKEETKEETTITLKSNGLTFLKGLAKVVASDGGLEEAKRQLKVGNIMNSDPITIHAIQQWRKACQWFETDVLKPLKAMSLKEVIEKAGDIIEQGADKTANTIKATISDPLQNWVDQRNKRNWFLKLIWP